jgi:phytoene synthase
VQTILEVADVYYTAGEAGISGLDTDSRLAVRAAARIYSAIGTRIRRRGFEVLDQRARVSTLGKLRIFALAMLTPAGGSRPMQLDDSARRALAAAERLLAEYGISVGG